MNLAEKRSPEELQELAFAFCQGRIFTGLSVLFVEAQRVQMDPGLLLRRLFQDLNDFTQWDWLQLMATKCVPFQWVSKQIATLHGLPVFAESEFLTWGDAMLVRHTAQEIYQTSQLKCQKQPTSNWLLYNDWLKNSKKSD